MSTFGPTPLPISVRNVTELIQTRINTGGIIQTAGRRNPGDGGGARYIYEETGRSALPSIRDGFEIAGSGADDYYRLPYRGIIDGRKYGCVAGRLEDMTDIFANMAADCVDFAVDEGDGSVQTAMIYIPHGDYRIRYWALPAQATIVGDGVENTYLIAAPNAGTCDFTASASTDYLTTKNFPWQIGRKLQFAGPSLPTGIVANKTYYVVSTTWTGVYDHADTISFKVSEVPGGVAINLTGDGSGLAIHGSFITDRGNAAKISFHDLQCWGNIKSIDDGFQIPDDGSDPDFQSPYVTSVFDLGATANKGLTSTDPWGTGAEMTNVIVYFFRNSIAYDIVNNISYMNKVWAEHCGQAYRIRGNGWGVNTAYATGNRGVSFQYNHSTTFNVSYGSPGDSINYEIFTNETVPPIFETVYFFGDDLPAGIEAHKPYYVRNSDLLTSFTADAGTDAITSEAHGLGEDYQLYFYGSDLPAPLQRDTPYYMINVTGNTFQLSATRGGSAIDITDTGSGVMQYVRHSFQITETYAGPPVDVGDNGSGEMRFSVYSTAAVDGQGGAVFTDMEIEAPFGYDLFIWDGSEQLQCNAFGVYWSLDNAGNDFTALASNDTFTLGAAIIGYSGITLSNGLEVYPVGDSLPAEITSNSRYWVRDLSGSTFKLAATEGGAAIALSTDGSGTLAITPKPNNLVRWVQSAGSVLAPRVSPGARGYTNFGTFRSGDGSNHELLIPESVSMSRVRHKGPLIADALVLPNLGGFAVLTADNNGVVQAARLELKNWFLNFNGFDTEVAMGSRIALTKPGEYTYSVRCTVESLNCILAGDTLSNDSYLLFFVDATTVRHNSYNNSGDRYLEITLPAPCNDGEMHHYVLRRMPGNVFTFWMDGVECDTELVDDPTDDPENPGNPIGHLDENFGWINVIGRRGIDPGAHFHGSMDFLRAWDKGLTAPEVTNEFAGTTPQTDLVLAYEFTNAAGSTISDFGPTNNIGVLTSTDIANRWVEDANVASVTTENKMVVDSGDVDTDVIVENIRTRLDEVVDVLRSQGLITTPATPTNLIGVSDQFDNVNWTKVQVTVDPDVASSPVGGVLADQVIASAANDEHSLTKATSGLTVGQPYTFSVYIKAETLTWITLYQTVGVGQQFDLTNGVKGGIFLGAPDSSIITDLGAGWYRCSITTVAASTTLTHRVYFHTAEDGLVFLGAGETALIDGAQLELGEAPGKYVQVTP